MSRYLLKCLQYRVCTTLFKTWRVLFWNQIHASRNWRTNGVIIRYEEKGQISYRSLFPFDNNSELVTYHCMRNGLRKLLSCAISFPGTLFQNSKRKIFWAHMNCYKQEMSLHGVMRVIVPRTGIISLWLVFCMQKKCSIFHAFPAISQDTEGTEQLLGDIPRKKGGPKQLFPCENWPSQLSRISQSGTGPNSDKYLLHLLVPFMFLAIWWNVWAEIKLWV